jgi:hypothetical protein
MDATPGQFVMAWLRPSTKILSLVNADPSH